MLFRSLNLRDLRVLRGKSSFVPTLRVLRALRGKSSFVLTLRDLRGKTLFSS